MEYRREISSANVDPVLVDWPVEADTLKKGEVVRLGLADGNDINAAVSAEGAVFASTHRILGICTEDIVSTYDLTDVDTYVPSNFAKINIQPFGVFEAEWSQDSGDDLTMLGDLTFTVTSGKGPINAGGSWLYIISGTGAGELSLVASSSVSTTTLTLVLANTGATTYDSSSNFILMLGRGQREVGLGDIDLVQVANIDFDVIVSTGTYGMPLIIVENYIKIGQRMPRVMQKGAEHSVADVTDTAPLTGLNNKSVTFSSQFVFGGLSHVFACSTGITRS